MKIIVCVKQVVQIYALKGFDPNTKDIAHDSIVYILNPYDEIATEEALRQKEKAGGGEVTVITFGPPRAEAALRWCLAMGVDKAVHVLDDTAENQGPWYTSSILSSIIKEMKYDLLLFGQKAIDDELGQVGIFVAELLNLPVVTSVIDIQIKESDKAKVQRVLEKGNREEVVCPIPTVLTVEKMLNHPRYPTFPGRKAARTKPIQKIDLPSLSLSPSDPKMVIVRHAPPKLKPKKILAPDSNMSAAARISFIMSGGMGQKKGGTVGGNPKQIVSSIIDFLKEKKVIGP